MLLARRNCFRKSAHPMSISCPRFVLTLLATAVLVKSTHAQSAASTHPVVMLESVTASQPLHDGVEVKASAATLRITALRDDIVRVRISPNSTLPEDASWAVLPAVRTKSVDVQPIQDSAAVGFRTAALEVHVERNPLRLVIRDLAGNVISADAIGRPVNFNFGGFTVAKQMPGGEHYYGLGDKAGAFDRRNQAYTLW